MHVSEVNEFTLEVANHLRRLLPQLSSNARVPTDEFFRRIVQSEHCHLLMAREAENVLGFLTLVVFPIPTGIRAWIEDVVVDSEARGKGVGEQLSQYAIGRAKALGASTIELTSRPSREAANRLYRRLGFQLRETNVYRYTISTT